MVDVQGGPGPVPDTATEAAMQALLAHQPSGCVNSRQGTYECDCGANVAVPGGLDSDGFPNDWESEPAARSAHQAEDGRCCCSCDGGPAGYPQGRRSRGAGASGGLAGGRSTEGPGRSARRRPMAPCAGCASAGGPVRWPWRRTPPHPIFAKWYATLSWREKANYWASTYGNRWDDWLCMRDGRLGTWFSNRNWLYYGQEWPSRLVCRVIGHMPIPDHCGIPDHDHCAYCGASTPGQAKRGEGQ